MINTMYIVGNVFEILAKIQYFEKTLTRKMNRFVTLCIWIGMFVIDDFLIQDIQFILKLAIYLLIMLFGIFVMYKGKIKQKIILIIFVSGFHMIAEVVTDVILLAINGMHQGANYYVMGYMISKIIFLIFLRVAVHVSKKKNEYDMGIKSFLSIIFIPSISIVLIEIFFVSRSSFEEITYFDFAFYNAILLINYITVIQYDDVQKMLYLDNQNKNLEKQKVYYIQQYDMTKKSWEMIRSMRHNMKNEYISQNILLENKKYDELKELYHDKIGELEVIDIPSKSGNIYVDAVVNYKISLIRDMGADFSCKIMVPEQINVENDDIVLLLGNLLDNVIDAFDNEELKRKSGGLIIAYEKSNLYIDISNTFFGSRIKKNNCDYETTKPGKELHGIGLKSIKSVVTKYFGSIEIADDNEIFTVTIVLQI